MTQNTVLILGVGRSGTTALYQQLQDIYIAEYGQALKSVYEPFLWDLQLFDRPLRDTDELFSNMSSVSYQGILENKSIPLFVLPDQVTQYQHRPFIREISCCPPERPALISKMIRANGRYCLLRSASPEARIVFILRNPLDVVNSSSEMFSFYGEDFHASDYERFQQEIIDIFGDEAAKLPRDMYVQKQAFYWYFMNRFFLEQSIDDQRLLKILYSEYSEKPEATHTKLCQFLDVDINKTPFTDSYKSKAGPSFSGITLSQEEIAGLDIYLELYAELLDKFFPGNTESIGRIRDKYKNASDKSFVIDRYFGKTPIYLRSVLAKKKKRGIIHKFKRIFR